MATILSRWMMGLSATALMLSASSTIALAQGPRYVQVGGEPVAAPAAESPEPVPETNAPAGNGCPSCRTGAHASGGYTHPSGVAVWTTTPGTVLRRRLFGNLICNGYCTYSPGHGWAPPAKHAIIPQGVEYVRYWGYAGQRQATGGNGAYAARYPSVYMPTDTTQLGFYYQQVPHWRQNPYMVPPVPNPDLFHDRTCGLGTHCGNAWWGGPVFGYLRGGRPVDTRPLPQSAPPHEVAPEPKPAAPKTAPPIPPPPADAKSAGLPTPRRLAY